MGFIAALLCLFLLLLLSDRTFRRLNSTLLVALKYGTLFLLQVMGLRRLVASVRHRAYEPLSRPMLLRLAFEDDPRNVHMFHAEGVPCIYIHSGYYE